MSTKTLEKKVNELTSQVMSLKTLIISSSLGRDPEGEYRSKFVREMLKAAKEPGIYKFTNAGDFLQLIAKRKKKNKK